jgi:integrase
MQDNTADHVCRTRALWNRAKLIGPEPPLKAKEIWSIRIRLQVAHRIRDLVLCNLALDSKLRACDLVALEVDDVAQNGQVRSRATVLQQKTRRPVQFEITEQTREAVGRWLEAGLHKGEPLFPSRIDRRRSITTRQYARLLGSWIRSGSTHWPTARTPCVGQRHR